MAQAFSRTLRSLHADGFRPSLLAITALLVLVGAWFGWFFLARVTLYETSAQARVEVAGAAHVIEAPVLGKVVSVHMRVGQEVSAGEPLVILETGREASRIKEESVHLKSLKVTLSALREAFLEESRALPSARRSDQEAIERARAIHREVTSAAEHAAASLDRIVELSEQGLASRADLEQARAESDQKAAEADAALRDLARLQWQMEFNDSQRKTRLAEIERQISGLEGEVGMVEAASSRLDHELKERSITAPVSGRLGEVDDLKPGSVVVPGERIAVVIPDGEFHVVARFPAGTALGRVGPGQKATLRLEAFPWITFGELAAEVERVGSETEGGGFTVELALDQDSAPAITLQHGQPGQVAIGVEQVSPAELLMRAAGKRLRARRAELVPSGR